MGGEMYEIPEYLKDEFTEEEKKEMEEKRKKAQASQSLSYTSDDIFIYTANGPMKLALSSGNNSDRHGAAKMEGSFVLNMAVHLEENGPPVKVEICRLAHTSSDPKLIFIALNDLSGKFEEKTYTLSKSDIVDKKMLFCVKNSDSNLPDEKINPNSVFSDTSSKIRLYLYALCFSDIIRYYGNESAYIEDPSLAWEDLMRFTGGRSLQLRVECSGPSQSGFSSSSAVLATLLAALYNMSGQSSRLSQLYDLTLLGENRLGLRSGWNDTYALKPGVHAFVTERTEGLPSPQTVCTFPDLNFETLRKRLVLVHTGLQRKATGRMNRRHEVYLSRDEKLTLALMQSVDAHNAMVDALLKEDWEMLGTICSEYMELRIQFDSAATNEYLKYFFKYLKDEGVIHGGLLAGAMGGGVANLILTPTGAERLTDALAALQAHTFEDGERPFYCTGKEAPQSCNNSNSPCNNSNSPCNKSNELFGVIEYWISQEGLHWGKRAPESAEVKTVKKD